MVVSAGTFRSTTCPAHSLPDISMATRRMYESLRSRLGSEYVKLALKSC